MAGTPVVEVRGINKSFGVTVALRDVSFAVPPGQVYGLIGENGSGKSTVSSIIAGMQPANSGAMLYNGEPWKPASMLQAQQGGIGMVVQEAGTVPNITVAENIFLGHEKRFARGLFVSRRRMYAEAQKLLDALGITGIAPAQRTAALDMQSRKLVEIAKALYWQPQLLIIDETTTALSHTGRELLYRQMERMAAEGKSVLFISHDLDELMAHCHTLCVLRDGMIVGTLDKADYDADEIKRMMVGREIAGDYYRSDTDGHSGEVVLSAECITTLHDLTCFSMQAHRGEIVGIGGLSDCGMHTVGRALFGIDKVLDGSVRVGPGGVAVKTPKRAIRQRMGYVSKNRDSESLGLSATIRDNIASTGYRLNEIFGPLISFRKEKRYVDGQVQALSIKCASQYHSVSTLSGGNKQKVALGKWLAADAQILILDCPTRGVDIGVKASIYQLMYEMKKAGKTIIMISEELPELIGMCDRILIMKDGEVVHQALRADSPTEHQLIEYMI